jgi:hypothetical protein
MSVSRPTISTCAIAHEIFGRLLADHIKADLTVMHDGQKAKAKIDVTACVSMPRAT